VGEEEFEMEVGEEGVVCRNLRAMVGIV